MNYSNNKKEKNILFSWSRTGASNIGLMLNYHPEISYIAEPFNLRKKILKRKPWRIIGLKKSLRLIWSKCNCFKHNHGLSAKQNKYLLLHPEHKIVFIWRKNAMKRLVSHHLALQTDIWGFNVDGEAKKAKLQEIEYQPLDIDKLKEDIISYKNEIKLYRGILETNKVNYYDICFEEFYESSSKEKQMAEIEKIFNFLGKGEVKDAELIKKIKWRFDPKNMKQSRYVKYDLIPNIAEIRKLESDDWGYLDL